MHTECKPIIIEVPLTPPSVNHYKVPQIRFKQGKPTIAWVITDEAVAYIEALAIFAKGQSLSPATDAEREKVRYGLAATVYFAKGEKGDGDNFFKCIADGLEDAGVIHSDARIRTWNIDVEDRDRANGGRTLIAVWRIDEPQQPLAEYIKEQVEQEAQG